MGSLRKGIWGKKGRMWRPVYEELLIVKGQAEIKKPARETEGAARGKNQGKKLFQEERSGH